MDAELRGHIDEIAERAAAEKSRILGSASRSSAGPLARAAEAFVAGVQSVSDREHYKVFPASCRDTFVKSEAEFGVGHARDLLHLTIILAVEHSLASGRLDALSPRLVRHQLGQFRRILSSIDHQADWLSINADFFHKEFGLASLRLYAAAAQVIDPNCGLPRSTVLKSGWKGLVEGAALAVRMGGFSPMFQIHTHSRYLDEFTPEGWDECYRCCVDLYRRFPKSRGMFGGSWFYDPQVEQVSPRLFYLQDVPRKGGASFFFTASEGDHVQNAIATSPSRRKLYEEGKYKPQSFTLVWPANAQRAAVRM